MGNGRMAIFVLVAIGACALIPLTDSKARDVVRPEEIRSKRQIVYDQATYKRLAGLWEEYYDEFPSEYAYANWMYAVRYAGDPDYERKLKKGVRKYSANPTLLYLAAMLHHGKSAYQEGRDYLERAARLDPAYSDPWFGLITHYMEADDSERLNAALRRILESGVITDDVMDYNYNMLIALEPNAILITNGDNDTFPGWILTRLLDVRPDVSIVNRSLLNTEWYPLHVIRHGVPRFTTAAELQALRTAVFAEMAARKAMPGAGGAVGDTLIAQLLAAASREDRPVYLSLTLYGTETIKRLREAGRNLGLVTLATPRANAAAAQMQAHFQTWIDRFRTGGLDSWRLHSAPATDAGRMLVANYAAAPLQCMDDLTHEAPELRGGLFIWYREHVRELLTEDFRAKADSVWCGQSDVPAIREWCRQHGGAK